MEKFRFVHTSLQQYNGVTDNWYIDHQLKRNASHLK